MMRAKVTAEQKKLPADFAGCRQVVQGPLPEGTYTLTITRPWGEPKSRSFDIPLTVTKVRGA